MKKKIVLFFLVICLCISIFSVSTSAWTNYTRKTFSSATPFFYEGIAFWITLKSTLTLFYTDHWSGSLFYRQVEEMGLFAQSIDTYDYPFQVYAGLDSIRRLRDGVQDLKVTSFTYPNILIDPAWLNDSYRYGENSTDSYCYGNSGYTYKYEGKSQFISAEAPYYLTKTVVITYDY